MANPVKALHDEIAAALVTVAESKWYAREAESNDAPPRYVWVPGGGKLEGARANGRNPRTVGQIKFRCAVVCWGADDDDAWRLMAALVSVVPRVVEGRNFEIGQVSHTNPPWISDGVSITVEVSLLVTVLEQNFDGVAEPGSSEGDVDRKLRVAAPLTPETIDPALSTAGDDVLESNEP